MVEELLDFAHYVFGVPYAWLTFPKVIGWFFIPLGLLIAIFYVFLEKTVRVLPSGGNVALAVIIALLCSRIAVITSGTFGMVGGIIVLSAALFGLSILVYRKSIEFSITVIWIILAVLSIGGMFGLWKEVVDWPFIILIFGILLIIALFARILKITRTSVVVTIIILLALTIIIPVILGLIRGYI
jgi:hypothetical protein